MIPIPSLQALADGSVAQAVLSKGEAGNYLSVAIAFGLAIAMGVYISGGVSGKYITYVSSTICNTNFHAYRLYSFE